MESAYLEEAAWYNAAYPTISQLVRECERDEPVLGEKTWRQVGLREGLPRTWKVRLVNPRHRCFVPVMVLGLHDS